MRTFVVDSFTDRPFRGNPAGVCIIEQARAIDDQLMLKIAQELGYSETAFVSESPGADARRGGVPRYDIRYFSPVMEIPLCGHATLASAHVLFHESRGARQINFVTRDGVLLSTQKENDTAQKGSRVAMSFPAYETTAADAPPAMLDAFGVQDVVNVAFNAETNILLLHIDSPGKLRELKPDYAQLVASHDAINGVLVTAESDDAFDFVSRYFWPWSGTNEDPVTGGTHTFLAPYWAKRLGRRTLQSYQASQRGGFMTVDVPGDGTISIIGQAITVFSGQLEPHCLD